MKLPVRATLSTICLLLFTHLAVAQTITTGAGGACTNYPLMLTGSTSGIYKIEWIKNSSTVEGTNYREWVNPVVVAGIENSGGNSATQLNNPARIFVSAGGSVYVIDYFNSRLQRWDPPYTTGVTVATGLDWPQDVQVDLFGNVLVSEHWGQRIASWPAGTTLSNLAAPQGMCMGSTGIIYVAEFWSNRVIALPPIFNTATPKTVKAGVTNSGGSAINQLDAPGDICVDPAGNMYVMDNDNDRIMFYPAFSIEGFPGTPVVTNVPFITFSSIFRDAFGYLYYTCASGTYILEPGSTTPRQIMNWGNSGMQLDASGNLYLSDGVKDCVKRYSPDINHAFYPTTPGWYNAKITYQNGLVLYSNSINVLQGPSTPVVSSNTPVCSGNALNLSATSSAGAAYEWSGPSGYLSPAQNPVINGASATNNGQYRVYAIETSNGCRSIPVYHTATVLPSVTPSVTITPDAGTNIFCAGSAVSFTAVGVNAGASPTYQWTVNGSNSGTGTSFTTSALNNGDVVRCRLTSNATCASPAAVNSNSLTMTASTAPVVISVTVPADATYTNGDNLDITVHYNQNVTIAGGIPSLSITLNTGGIVQANYISGSGSSDILFRYTIGATEQDPDGIQLGSIALNGATLRNTNGCTAINTLNNVPPTTGILIHNFKPQTITFNALPDKTYGDADFDPAATASSGLTVSYTSSNTAVAIIVGGQVQIVGFGSTTITASQAGNAEYFAAAPVQQSLTVLPKAITITAVAVSKVYGDSDPSLIYTYSPALVGTDAFTGSLIRTTGENVGIYSINQGSLALSANYTIIYNSADLTITPKAITVTAQPKTKIYGDADPALTYTYTPALIGSDAFTGALVRTAGENIGAYSINQGTLALSANYTIAYNTANLVITAKTIFITAQPQTKVYGDADPVFTYTYTPALTGTDAFTGTLMRVTGENTGNYAINQGSLALNSNYAITYTSNILTVTKAVLTVTALNKTICFGETAGTIAIDYTGFKFSDDVSSLSTRSVAPVPAIPAAGDYIVTPSGGSAINYTFVYLAGRLTVLPSPDGSISQALVGSGIINAPAQTGGEQLTAPAGTGYTYLWNTNETSSSIFVIYSGNYSVDVTNTLGCTTKFTIVVKQRTLIIPNIFSPNGDNINDKWVIQNLENYPGSIVNIYNRYGQAVHRMFNSTPWDGRINGKDMPVGTYYYVIDLKNGAKAVTGYIDIIR